MKSIKLLKYTNIKRTLIYFLIIILILVFFNPSNQSNLSLSTIRRPRSSIRQIKTEIDSLSKNGINSNITNSTNANNKDPLSSLSNEELEKMLQNLDNKKNSTLNKLETKSDSLASLDLSTDPINTILDMNSNTNPKFKNKIESRINSLIRENKNALRKFKLKEKDAFNLIRTLHEYKFFSKLPVSARNIINVRNALITININILLQYTAICLYVL